MKEKDGASNQWRPTKKDKLRHDYSMSFDAEEDTEDSVTNNEYLCLDSTYYGNIVRFLNHHCSDANLEYYNKYI